MPIGATIPAVMAGIGLISQYTQAQKAQHAADAAMSQQQALVARQQAAYDQLKGLYDSRVASGVYNPASRIDQFQQSLAHNDAIVTGNLGAAAKTMGYRPGDTAPLDALGTNADNYKLQEAEGEQSIRNAVNQQQMNDMSVVNSGSGALSGGLGASQYDLGLAQQQQGLVNPGQILGPLAGALINQYGTPGTANLGAIANPVFGTGPSYTSGSSGLSGPTMPGIPQAAATVGPMGTSNAAMVSGYPGMQGMANPAYYGNVMGVAPGTSSVATGSDNATTGAGYGIPGQSSVASGLSPVAAPAAITPGQPQGVLAPLTIGKPKAGS